MSTPKTPTPQGISALLRKAGFEKSVTSTTRVRGWHSRSWGFVVRGYMKGIVYVHHEDGGHMQTDEAQVARVREQERYAVAIESAGYAVERGEGGYFGPIIVRALPGQEA